MTTLTDRYVLAVTEHLPATTRDDVARELRTTILDSIDSRPDLPAADAERAALVELGDPAALAASYSGGPQHLIGPAYYGAWKRLLLTLLAIVPAVAAVGTLVAYAVAPPGGSAAAIATTIVAAAITTWFEVAVQVVLWTTVAFAIAERAGAVPRPRGPWTPDALPLTQPARPVGAIVGTAFWGAAAAIVAFVPAATVLWLEGQPYPLFTDVTANARWLFVAVFVANAVIGVVRFVAGRWTPGTAVLNGVADVLLIAAATWLLFSNNLPDLGNPMWRVVTLVIITVFALWDVFATFRAARV